MPVADLADSTSYMRELDSRGDSNVPYDYLAERDENVSGLGQNRSCVNLVESQNIRINNVKWQRWRSHHRTIY